MADAAREEQWLRAAWTVAWVRAGLTGERLVPAEITPYKPKKPAKSDLHIQAESRQSWTVLDAMFGAIG